ncbi:MAG: hypothetical protein KBS66_07950 [Eubacterium sp.]|nr:hypothetical protein [Candidatus Colimonas fimequi]
MLMELPEGKLHFRKQKGKSRPFMKKNGKDIYLNKKQIAIMEGLKKREDIEARIEGVDSNIRLLEMLIEELIELEVLIPENADVGITGMESRTQIANRIDKWKEETENARSNNYYENGKHITSDGTYVKSRVELVLYEFFKAHGIKFIYEKVWVIDGREWRPDFTLIRESDGAVFIWEHFGMMDIIEYRQQAEEKIYHYAANGFWPYKNIIYTYDFGNDQINMQQIERILVMLGFIA